MNPVEKIARKLVGLFVDDGSLAGVILVWIGLLWIGARFGGLHPAGFLLFAGLAVGLLVSVYRFAKGSAGRRS